MDTSNFKEVFESPKVKALTTQVATLELEVVRLRNALETFIAEHEECEDGDGWMAQMCSMEALHVADEAVSTPSTPQALHELIEQVDVGSVGWKHDCAALCANDIELWIDRCPHCGKPRHNHPPTDDELLNKAEQVESEPVAWCLAYDDPNLKLRIHSNPTMCEAEIDAHVKGLNGALSKAPLYTTPQPGRVAELEAETTKLKLDLLTSYGEAEELSGKVAELEKALKVAKAALTQFLDPEYNPPEDTGEWRVVLEAISKINEVLKP